MLPLCQLRLRKNLLSYNISYDIINRLTYMGIHCLWNWCVGLIPEFVIFGNACHSFLFEIISALLVSVFLLFLFLSLSTMNYDLRSIKSPSDKLVLQSDSSDYKICSGLFH